MTYSLADALSDHDIRVNALHPGLIETTMTTEDVPIATGEFGEQYLETVPSGRLGEPEDIAKAALFFSQ